MPIKTKRIHLIDSENKMVRLEGIGGLDKFEGKVWESGYWSLPESKAKQLLGGSILFHKKSSQPSYFGGIILNYRMEGEGRQKGQITFTFEYRADHRMVMAEGRGWKAMKVVDK